MTASERIRAARIALAEFNSILDEMGEGPTSFDELVRAGIVLEIIEAVGSTPVEVPIAATSPLYS